MKIVRVGIITIINTLIRAEKWKLMVKAKCTQYKLEYIPSLTYLSSIMNNATIDICVMNSQHYDIFNKNLKVLLL